MGSYEVDHWNGVIEPKQTQTINIKLRTEILGKVQVNFVVKLDGPHRQQVLTLNAISIGPDVRPDREEIDWGKVTVLKPKSEKVKIKNEAQIDAEYTAFTKNKDTIWKVVQRYGVLKPFEEKAIEVICTADEVQRFTDTLHIIVNNGHDLEVQLKAVGSGTTLTCEKNIEDVDFETEYTYKNVPKQFFLENRGRKQMKIIWVRQNKMDRKRRDPKAIAQDPGASKASGIGGTEEKKEDEQCVFTVVPEQITLGPKMGIMIEFRAFSQ